MDPEDRTALPTERRRRQAREKGLGPRSSELSHGFRALAIAAGLQFFGPVLVAGLLDGVSQSFQPAKQAVTIDEYVTSISSSASTAGWSLIGFWALITGSAIASRMVQVGVYINPAELIPDLLRLNPATGVFKMFSWNNLTLTASHVVKLTLYLGLTGWYLWNNHGTLLALMEEELAEGSVRFGTLVVSLFWAFAGLQLVLGCLDFGWQYWKFEQSLKMTPDEVRDER